MQEADAQDLLIARPVPIVAGASTALTEVVAVYAVAVRLHAVPIKVIHAVVAARQITAIRKATIVIHQPALALVQTNLCPIMKNRKRRKRSVTNNPRQKPWVYIRLQKTNQQPILP
ncbi:hypothetical protein D3C71_1768820 [compost metagenome]